MVTARYKLIFLSKSDLYLSTVFMEEGGKPAHSLYSLYVCVWVTKCCHLTFNITNTCVCLGPATYRCILRVHRQVQCVMAGTVCVMQQQVCPAYIQYNCSHNRKGSKELYGRGGTDYTYTTQRRTISNNIEKLTL